MSVDLAHHEIFCVKVGKGGINDLKKAVNVDFRSFHYNPTLNVS